MPDRDDVRWFKAQFQPRIQAAIAGTPLSVDLVVAIACQETGDIWSRLRRAGLAPEAVLALCVGDTLDADRGRRAFPTTRAELLAAPRGAEMFEIAHQALVDMAVQVPGFQAVAQRPAKFCHGFGLFQRDLQFFRDDPDFFLERRWADFDGSFAQCRATLTGALRRLGLQTRAAPLTDLECGALGIVYNTGSFSPAKGMRQGHFDGTRFYGEAIVDFLRIAHTVEGPADTAAAVAMPAPGQAIVVAPPAPRADGALLKVDTREGMLRLRSAPALSDPPQANVIAHLPDGHLVRELGAPRRGRFAGVQTSLGGALLQGFASRKFLVAAPADAGSVPVERPAADPAASVIPAVTMPRRAGSVTRRRDPADAHSLNEPGQPSRAAGDAPALRAEIGTIVDWLAVDDARQRRYQPHDGLSFCNVYAHDLCHLAGVYLPRVFWTETAQSRWRAGESVEPLIGATIVELRANDLFRWLRAFGPAFGWRQAASTDALQADANQGAIGLIVARRKEDGRSGHIVVVVPETAEQAARRDSQGRVLAPLQSQAGTRNVRRGSINAGWWNGEAFAESAFWVHA